MKEYKHFSICGQFIMKSTLLYNFDNINWTAKIQYSILLDVLKFKQNKVQYSEETQDWNGKWKRNTRATGKVTGYAIGRESGSKRGIGRLWWFSIIIFEILPEFNCTCKESKIFIKNCVVNFIILWM